VVAVDIVELSRKLVRSFEGRRILVLLDGLRYDHAERYLKSYAREIERLESLKIPSTAPVITSFNLMCYPGEHGIYAWRVYVEELDTVVEPLPYSVEGSPIPFKKHLLLNDVKRTMFTEIDASSYAFLPIRYFDSQYSSAVYMGAERIGYISLSQVLEDVRKIVRRDREYNIHIYYPNIDALQHEKGVVARYVARELSFIKWFLKRLRKIAGDCEILLLSDHGQISVKKHIEVKEVREGCFLCGESRAVITSDEELVKCLERRIKDCEIFHLTRKRIRDIFGCYSRKVRHLRNAWLLQVSSQEEVLIDRDPLLGAHGGGSKEELEIPLVVVR